MFHEGIWYSAVDDDVDIQSGDRTRYTFHLKGFTERQERAVYTALTGEGGEA